MYQICISGAAKGKSLDEGAKLAELTGQAIAKAGHALLTGATTGIPYYAAKAYKEAGGKISVGISPAATKIEHVVKYRLPTVPYDAIIYSGLHYTGRDALLITSSDAVVTIGGRLGTLHEFAIAVESDTPVAVLEGAGGESDELKSILKTAGREPGEDIVFGDDPKELLKELIAILDDHNHRHMDLYK